MDCRSTEFFFIKKRDSEKEISCEFCEISHNTFFKETLGRLLLHKESFCLLFHHDLQFFRKRCHTYFQGKYFLGLRYRFGISSLFPILSQTPIFNPVDHLQRSLFLKIVNSLKPLNILAKKVHLQIFNQVLKTSL